MDMKKTIGAGLAIATVVSALGVGSFSRAQAHPGIPSNVWDVESVDWESVRNLDPAAWDAKLAENERDFIVIDFDADMTDEGVRRSAVFQRNLDGRNWLLRTELTSAEFSALFDDVKGHMRLVDIESFVQDGQRLWGGLFVENVEGYGWSAKRNLTYDQFSAYYKEQRSRRMPVDVDIYDTRDGPRFNLVWVDNAEDLDWRLHGKLTRDQYQAQVDAYADHFRALMTDGTTTAEGDRYATIWTEDPTPRGSWVRSDLTAQQYENWWNRYRDEGYRPIYTERYKTAGGDRYALVVRQNSDRPFWKARTDVDDLVKAKLEELGVPGIAVAVMQNGNFLYRRGFGFADVDDGVWLDSNHVMRLASIAKGVSGVLTMELAEQGDIDVDDPVADYVDDIPAHHTYSIEQAVSNRACVRHYGATEEADGFGTADQLEQWKDEDATLASISYDSATTAAAVFWDSPLVCTVGTWHYTTHGSTTACSALEGATGKTAWELIEDEITGPLAVTTLRAEDRSDASVRWSQLFDSGNDEITDPDDSSWKVCGGGLVSSATDLARFGDKVLSGNILSQASRDAMWVDAPWSYAYGWSVDTEDGHLRVGKNGSSDGSTTYMQMYPDDGVTIVVLMNRDDLVGGNAAESLGKDIGALVLESLA